MIVHAQKKYDWLRLTIVCLMLVFCCAACIIMLMGLTEEEWVKSYHAENTSRMLAANDAISDIQLEIENSMFKEINYSTLVEAVDIDPRTENGLEKIENLNAMLLQIRNTNSFIYDAIIYDAGQDVLVTTDTYVYRKSFKSRIYQYDFDELIYALAYSQPLSSRGSLGAYGFIYYSPDDQIVKNTVMFVYVPIMSVGRSSNALLLMVDKNLILNCLLEEPLIENAGCIIFSRNGKILTRGDEAFVKEGYTPQALYERIQNQERSSGYIPINQNVFAYYSINPNNGMVITKLTRTDLLSATSKITGTAVAICKYIAAVSAVFIVLLGLWLARIMWRSKKMGKDGLSAEALAFPFLQKRKQWSEAFENGVKKIAQNEPEAPIMVCFFSIDSLAQKHSAGEEKKIGAVYQNFCKKLQKKIGVYAKTEIIQGNFSALLIQAHEEGEPLDAKMVFSIASHIHSHYDHGSDVTFSLLVSRVYASAQHLLGDMQNLLSTLKTTMLKKSNTITCMPQASQKGEESICPIVKEPLRTLPYILEKDQNLFNSEILRIVTYEFRWDAVSYSGILFQGCSLVNACIEYCMEKNVKIDLNYDVFLKELMEKESLQEVVRYICSTCEFIYISYHHVTQSDSEDEASPDKENVASYIHEHYMEDISLSKISEYYEMSDSYFSKYFKKQMNVSFNIYLHSYRMKKLQEILDENPEIAMQDAAKMLGYNSYKTFYRQYNFFFGHPPKK